jgi:Putative auto-transporter adhesin, head GIN domain
VIRELLLFSHRNALGHTAASRIFLESNVRRCCIVIEEFKFYMKNITILSLAGCAVLLAGCWLPGIRGNGHIKTEERTIGAFANVDAGGVFDIEWQKGPPALRITTDENLLPYIESDISGDALRLRMREHVWPTHGVKVVMSSPTRAGAKIRGAVKLTANKLSGPVFALESKGASEVSLDGEVDRLLVDMTGASELVADGLQTKTAEISTTGAGDADITVSETLKVVITGAGKVTYSGNPTIQKNISGAGSVRHKD